MQDKINSVKTKKMDYIETKNDIQTLAEIREYGFYLRLDMCHYGLELKACIIPRISGPLISPSYLTTLFDKKNIKGSLSRQNLDRFCYLANQGRKQSGVTLVRGLCPVEGSDEIIKFNVKPKSNQPHVHSHGETNMQIGCIQTNTFFENISTGDIIAKRTPPEDGIDGVAVDGSSIPPIRGKRLLHSPIPGKGVRLDKKTHCFYAETSGCVIYNEGRGIISVDEKLVISDDIDFIVGHIDFIGTIEIHGDILDDLHIKSDKNIIISGHVGNCQIEARGDVSISGMSGHGNGSIRCGGVFRARYLDGVNIDALGDIIVANEIIDSQINTAGALRCPAARIIGGCCTVLSGIDVGELGSEGNIPTKIIVGRSFIAHKLVSILNHKILRSIQRHTKISPLIRPFIHSPEKIQQLEEKQQSVIKNLISEEQKLLLLRKKCEALLKSENKKARKGANPIISVGQGIWQGVQISFGITTETIKDVIDHPTSIINDNVTGHYKLIRHQSIKQNIKSIGTTSKTHRRLRN